MGSNPTPDIILSKIQLATGKVYPKLTTPAGIRTPDLWIRNPTRYPLRYKGCVRIRGHQDTNYANWFHPHSTIKNMSPRQSHLHVPVAQSVSARYLYCSTCEKCRGCEFEPHLEQWFWSKQFYFLERPTNYCPNDPARLFISNKIIPVRVYTLTSNAEKRVLESNRVRENECIQQFYLVPTCSPASSVGRARDS